MKNFPGVDVPLDGASGHNGLSWFTTSMDPDDLTRSYSRTGHWDGLDRDNYSLVTGTKVRRVVLEEGRAVGVEVHPRGDGEDVSVVRAKKEVILAAGAIHTPQVLMLSGFGGPAPVFSLAHRCSRPSRRFTEVGGGGRAENTDTL